MVGTGAVTDLVRTIVNWTPFGRRSEPGSGFSAPIGELPARELIDHAAAGFVAMDAAGRVSDWNPAAEAIFGWTREEILGRRMTETIMPPATGATSTVVERFLKTERGTLVGRAVELEAVRRDGSPALVSICFSAIPDAERAQFCAFIHDLSERSVAEDALRESEERFREAFDHAPVGMSLTSLDGVFMRVNHALAEILGRPIAVLEGMAVAEVTHPQDRAADQAAIHRMAAGRDRQFSTEKRYVHADGHLVWVSMSASVVPDGEGRPAYFVAQMEDITRRKETEDRLAYLADHDPLTGLYNRRRFERELERLLAHCQRYDHQLAVLLIDLDTFKQINDTLGHAIGDEALVRTAHLLKARLRRTDVLARLGGDEFAAILPEASYERIHTVACDLLSVIRSITVGEGQEAISLSASAGIALLSDRPPAATEDMLRHADEAMYQAKKAGRDTYRLTPHVLAGASSGQRPTLEDLLRTVAEFGEASVGLVAWEFLIAEDEVAPLWQSARRLRLIQPGGHDPHTGEPTFELTAAGLARLDGAPLHSGGDRAGSDAMASSSHPDLQ
jgi:diguanylate cyclase (GGDEF)-like protein/PAS domain S-box-containing protein